MIVRESVNGSRPVRVNETAREENRQADLAEIKWILRRSKASNATVRTEWRAQGAQAISAPTTAIEAVALEASGAEVLVAVEVSGEAAGAEKRSNQRG